MSKELFIANIPTIICLIVASALAYRGADGWGWFLFAALLLAHGIKSTKDKKEKKVKPKSKQHETPQNI